MSLNRYIYPQNKLEMRKNSGSIPVNKFGSDLDRGLSIERFTFESLPDISDWEQPERHDRHTFFLIVEGCVTIEIDFQVFEIHAPSIIYMHPDQVHRIIGFKRVTSCVWAAENDQLNATYLNLLEEIAPGAPILLNNDRYTFFYEAVQHCLNFAERKEDQLYHSLLKDHINLLVGLMISVYLEKAGPADHVSRQEAVTKSFREALATHFMVINRPVAYAQKLNLSLTYLNECVKNTTGHPVSYHIQQRVILEAKRLLYHSDLSVKEIAAKLGYEDYPYFTRFFAKVAGRSPLSFRRKNLD